MRVSVRSWVRFATLLVPGLSGNTMREATFGHVTPENLALFTDLYELAMMQGYHETGHNPMATFSLFFRELPPHRGYVVAAGLEQVVAYLESLSFGPEEIEFLREQGYRDAVLERLAGFEFTGEVRALPEGTPVFPNEPLLEVTAPIFEAQLFETMLINQIGFQSLIATKAARMRDVIRRKGDGQSLVDFGSRRGHGTDAGVKAARAAYLGGFSGTSNVLSSQLFGLPLFGTMAHSWIQSFASEREAFESFVDVYGADSVLLIDTYDTVAGARLAMEVAEDRGIEIAGVRLDSGDLIELSKEVAPLVGDADIFISSGMDEYAIAEFLDGGGIGSGFGPGTALVTSADAPKLELVYKLTEVERNDELGPSMKLSEDKVTYPGAKGVSRVEEAGEYQHDVIGLHGEETAGKEQLVTVFEDGRLVYDLPNIETIRDRTRREISRLPPGVRDIRDPVRFEVGISEGLESLTKQVRADLESRL